MAKLGINTGIVPDDGLGDSLLNGAVKINGNFDEIYTYFGDGTNLTFTGGSSSQWDTTSSGIHTLSNVGIGTTNPTENLTVFGDARVTGILTIGTASITLDGSSNIITVGSGVTIDGSTGIIEATSLVVGGTTLTGAAVTSITAGTGISVDQSTGNVTISATGGGGGGESYWDQTTAGIHTLSNVGIGTTNPTSKLTVKGNTSLETLSVSGVSTFNNDIKIDNGIIEFGSQNNPEGKIRFWNSQNSSDAYVEIYRILNSAYFYNKGTNAGGIFIRSRGNVTLGGGDNEYSVECSGDEVRLFYDDNQKLRTTGAGVTVTGTTFTNQLSISGVSTFSGQCTFDSGIILSGESSNLSGSQRIILSGGEGGDTQLYNGGTAFSSFIFNSMQGGSTIEVGRLNGSGTLNLPLSQGGINVSGISTLGTVQVSSGIVTASSGIVTYYGDTSNATDGRWTLGANGTSDYTFTGIGFTQTTNDPVLYLARGRVYEFVNNSGGSHPFEIRVSNGGAAYDDGVTNNGAASGVIRFEIPFNAPNTLYYQCTVHSGMGNTISVYPSTI
jgi:hypothetical protein